MAEPALIGFIRIDSSNNALRVTMAGSTTTETVTAGTYWFGTGNGGPSGPATDASVYTPYGESFLDALVADTTVVNAILETSVDQTITSPAATGHVHIQGSQAGDAIHWSDAATTMDPYWFGVANASNTTVDAALTDVSEFQSSLVFVGNTSADDDGGYLLDERLTTTYLENTLEADSGKIQSQFYGSRRKRILDFRLFGIPRNDTDLPYHSMRRFIDGLHNARAGLSFVYLKDMSNVTEWDPDKVAASREGYWRAMFDPGQVLQWDDPQEFPGYNNIWRKSFLAKEWTP